MLRFFLLLLGLAIGVGVSAFAVHHHYDRLAEMGIVPAQPEPKAQTIVQTEVINNTVNPCAWRESRSISFTSWDEKDSATVEVFGPDCRFSVISLTIRDEFDRVVFYEIAEFSGITAYEETAEEMPKIIADYWDVIGPRKVGEFSDMVALKEQYGDDEEGTTLYGDQHVRALAADAPIICMSVHYEYTHCYWRDAERNSTKRMISFGA